MVDHDMVEVGNIVRHELGASSIGLPKASTLAQRIRREFPLCDAEGIDADFLSMTKLEQLRLVSGADVVVAATDTAECQRRVNEVCLEAGVTSVYPAFWVDPASGTRDAEVGEIFWFRPGQGMPCYACLTSWRPAETGTETRGGTRADVQVVVLATLWVIAALLDPQDERALVLNPERSFILVHGFMPIRSDAVRVMFNDSDDSGLLSLRVPFPRTPCRTCRGHRPPSPRAAAEPVLVGGLAALREANLVVAQAEAHAERERVVRESRRRLAAEQRTSLLRTAHQQFETISTGLRNAVLFAAPSAKTGRLPELVARWQAWEIELGTARLRLSIHREIPSPRERYSSSYMEEWTAEAGAPFDVIAYCILVAGDGRPDARGYVGRAHALWFGDPQTRGRYGWYENAFTESSRIPELGRGYLFYGGATKSLERQFFAPLALTPEQIGVRAALKHQPSPWELVWPFTLARPDAMDNFISRLAGWFADAAGDGLRAPVSMPELDPTGSWRTEGY
jgi:hypothetical protein